MIPIDTEAIAAQAKAEHEYGERLMDLATYNAEFTGQESVTVADVEWAVKNYDNPFARLNAQLQPKQQLRCICAERMGAK